MPSPAQCRHARFLCVIFVIFSYSHGGMRFPRKPCFSAVFPAVPLCFHVREWFFGEL